MDAGESLMASIMRKRHPNSITCPDCHFTSYHPQDVLYGFCGNCHAYTGKPAGTEVELNRVGTTLCPMVLSATGRPCLGKLVTCGVLGMNQCDRCGTWGE